MSQTTCCLFAGSCAKGKSSAQPPPPPRILAEGGTPGCLQEKALLTVGSPAVRSLRFMEQSVLESWGAERCFCPVSQCLPVLQLQWLLARDDMITSDCFLWVWGKGQRVLFEEWEG